MSLISGIIVFSAGILLGILIAFVLIKRQHRDSIDLTRQMETVFGSLSREALDKNQKTFLELAKAQFETLLSSSDKQLEEKKKLINSTIRDMKANLEHLTKETTALKGQMQESSRGIHQLTDTTSKLRQILSSSQARGAWGERMVEDILNFIGLVEGINYKKQVSAGKDRPDYTFYLPRSRHINMDVKFPLSHYEAYLAARSEKEKEKEKKQFIQDVRNHIRAVSGREYVNPDEGTVDYVLLFIPNESIYTFLNREDAKLVDYSLERKIVICSPVTLYAILSLIRQSVTSFSIEKRASDIQSHIQSFKMQWTKFLEKMESLGKSLKATQNHYEDLSTTRVKQLDRPMEKILDINLKDEAEGKEMKEIEN